MPWTRGLACLLWFTLPARGQGLPSVADTAGYVKGAYTMQTDRFYLGTFTTTDSTTVRAYLPTARRGYERAIDYFETPPGRPPSPKRYTLSIIQVHTMRVHGRYYENLFVEDESLDVLALRLLDGPVELFTYAEPRTIPVALPLPEAQALFAGVDYTRTHWYLRRGREVTTLRRGQFAAQLSAYLADCPAVAGPVARGEAHYRYQDTPAILAAYNQCRAAAGQ